MYTRNLVLNNIIKLPKDIIKSIFKKVYEGKTTTTMDDVGVRKKIH